MKVLIVGGGGREHTLAWKIARSPRVEHVYCAPGNPGIARTEKCSCIELRSGAEPIDELLRFAKRERIDLTVPGPEAPLVAGIVDRFEREDLRIFGPNARAAELEGSKVFTKNLLRRHGIPTAEFRVFETAEKAHAHAEESGAPLVVKADGLAAGKGVTVGRTLDEIHAAIERIMVERAFGEAGARVVLEECLVGQEASILAITDGRSIVPLESSQDHKPVYNNDQGPNTGGMGAYSPAPVVTDEMMDRIVSEVLVPIVHAMNKEHRPYKGVLYAGLMITAAGPKVIEFNVRFGDPEAQVVFLRLQSDLVDLLEASIDERLAEVDAPVWDPRPAVCVVMASGGYPAAYEQGLPITGLDQAATVPDVTVFHAGTRTKDSKGTLVTSGGRVLGVTALGEDLPAAIDRAYEAAGHIHFDRAHYRTDIGAKALQRLDVKG